MMEEVTNHRFVCDFCEEDVDEVKRIALDVGYDRVLAEALYACSECSDRKELERKLYGK
jgi:ribosomal protein L37AE/L43A